MTPIRPWSISGRLQTQSTMRKLFQVKMPRALMLRSSDCAENSPDANTHALCVSHQAPHQTLWTYIQQTNAISDGETGRVPHCSGVLMCGRWVEKPWIRP